MPYKKPSQARAVAASYKKRGKKMPRHVASEVGKTLRGKPGPKRKK